MRDPSEFFFKNAFEGWFQADVLSCFLQVLSDTSPLFFDSDVCIFKGSLNI